MMFKTIWLSLFMFALSFNSYAMETSVGPQEAQINPFDGLNDDRVRQITDYFDRQSCAHMRKSCSRFNKVVWQFDKDIEITPRRQFRSDDQSWQKVIVAIGFINAMIERFQAHNDIIICLLDPVARIHSLSKELSTTNVVGLRNMDLNLNSAELEKLPGILPNLKFLELFVGYGYGSLPTTLKQLTQLKKLAVFSYVIEPQNFALIPPSVDTLALGACGISDIPQESVAQLTSLRSLSFEHSYLKLSELEKLLPLSPYVVKLNISWLQLEKLPRCLASFEKLQELNLSFNDLEPQALSCIKRLKNLSWINLSGNDKCMAQKELVRSMFPPSVTIEYNTDPYCG